jgi:preprotein translocase subunit SecF
MAWRFRLAPEKTNFDFFRFQWLTFGGSMMLTVVSIVLWAVMGLNFGIDFRGGTTIRTEATQPVDVAAYREALSGMELGDVAITQVFDPSFREDQHVAQVRIAPLDGVEAVTPETIAEVEARLQQVDPSITFPSVESSS